MKSCRRSSPLALCACLALAATPSSAQEDQIGARGFAPERVYDTGDLDAINLFNGNLTLAMPIGFSYPVGGDLSYGLTLVYNSLAWELEEAFVGPPGEEVTLTRPVPSAVSNAGLGWTLTLGILFPPSTLPINPHALNWLYVGPDGAKHTLYTGELHQSFPADPDFDDGSATTLYSRDSTYLRMRQVDADTREIDFPNGTIHTFEDQGTDSAPGWELVSIRDRFGNELAVSYAFDQTPNPALWTWTLTDKPRPGAHGRAGLRRPARPLDRRHGGASGLRRLDRGL